MNRDTLFLGATGLLALFGLAVGFRLLNPASQKINDKNAALAAGGTITKGEDCKRIQNRLDTEEGQLEGFEQKMIDLMIDAEVICTEFSTAGDNFFNNTFGSANVEEKESCLKYIATGRFVAACGGCMKLEDKGFKSRLEPLRNRYIALSEKIAEQKEDIADSKRNLDSYLNEGVIC